MNLLQSMQVAARSLLRNRTRSLLTMLGIIIVVAAVIVTISIGAGARVSVQQSINGLGSNLLIIVPGSVTQGGARSGFGGVSTLTPNDGLALAALPHVAAVSPMVTARAQVISNGNNWQTQINGVSPSYTFIRTWPLASGTTFRDTDVAASAEGAGLRQTVGA